MVMVNEEGQHWGEISHWRISHALRYWFGWALAIVGQVGWVSAILRFEWWAWRYGSLCPIRCFFSTVSLRTSASNGPWDLFTVRLWNGGSLSNAWFFFTTCCRYVSIDLNSNVLVEGDQQTLRFSLCSSDAGPLQARCQEKWPGVGLDTGAQ